MPLNSISHSSIRVISTKEFLKITSLSRTSHFEKLNKASKSYDPTYPRPLRLGARSVGYVEQEVIDWVKARMEERK